MPYTKTKKQKTKTHIYFFFACVFYINHNIHYLLTLFSFLIFIPYYTHDLMNTFIPNHWYKNKIFFHSYLLILKHLDNCWQRCKKMVTWLDAISWQTLATLWKASPFRFLFTSFPPFSLPCSILLLRSLVFAVALLWLF